MELRAAGTIERERKETFTWQSWLGRGALLPALIFVVSLAGYYASTTTVSTSGLLQREPPDWYQHHIYLAKAILSGGLDVAHTGIPDFYQDVVVDGDKRFLPFPPGPALLLLPFVAIWGTGFSEIYFTMVLGALNVVLFWYLLETLGVSGSTKLLLVPFFAFGTPHFYSATTGTVWFYNHVVATTFLLLAIIALLKRTPLVVPALLLGFAFLAREPTILAAPFFLYWLIGQRHRSVLSKKALLDRQTLYEGAQFASGLVPFVIFFFWYNVARFHDPLITGYGYVHDHYAGIPYSFYLKDFPNAPRFNVLDVRNIPLHLYTMFLMPPQFHPDWSVFRPSPYGMSLVLTSPAFVYSALVKRNDVLKPASWTAIGLVSIPLLLHWTQGWVQFGYRFMLDFAPFLLILTALGFEDNQSRGATRMKVALVAVSIVAGFWGRYWANVNGW